MVEIRAGEVPVFWAAASAQAAIRPQITTTLPPAVAHDHPLARATCSSPTCPTPATPSDRGEPGSPPRAVTSVPAERSSAASKQRPVTTSPSTRGRRALARVSSMAGRRPGRSAAAATAASRPACAISRRECLLAAGTRSGTGPSRRGATGAGDRLRRATAARGADDAMSTPPPLARYGDTPKALSRALGGSADPRATLRLRGKCGARSPPELAEWTHPGAPQGFRRRSRRVYTSHGVAVSEAGTSGTGCPPTVATVASLASAEQGRRLGRAG